MDLNFEAMERELVEERDLDREAWLRGERPSDKGLTIIWTGFGKLTPTEHAQRAVRRMMKHREMSGGHLPLVPSVNEAQVPSNCSYSGCKVINWFAAGQGVPFCEEHNTKEIRDEYGYD